MTSWSKRLGKFVLVCGVLYLIALGLLVAFERRLLFVPPATALPLQELPDRTRSHRLRADDGTALRLLMWRAAPDHPTVLYFTGNGTDASRAAAGLAILKDWGVGLAVLDYRGYGESQGAPSEAGLMLDAQAAWRFLREEQRLAAEDIVVWGRSLGSGPATWLATQTNPRLLVVQAGYSSLPEVAARQYPMFPVQWVMDTRFPNEARMAKVRSPVVVAHSPTDRLIPFAQGRRLYRAAQKPLAFFTFQGGHNGSLLGNVEQQRLFHELLLRPTPSQ